MALKRTQNTVKIMEKILNENAEVQFIMNRLVDKAKENGLSAEEWQETKERLFLGCFFQLAERDETIRNDLANDLYESLEEG